MGDDLHSLLSLLDTSTVAFNVVVGLTDGGVKTDEEDDGDDDNVDEVVVIEVTLTGLLVKLRGSSKLQVELLTFKSSSDAIE